jgi:uncharacterized protein (DUF2147 family)
MKFFTLFIAFFLFTIYGNTQSIIGKWKTIDDETGKAKSIVKIYKKGDKYFGKVVDILNPTKKKNKCNKCTDSRKNQPILGMEIIKGLEQDDKEFEDGTILDPNNGKIYDCKIWLENKNTLNVRGYILFFFRTQTWTRVE